MSHEKNKKILGFALICKKICANVLILCMVVCVCVHAYAHMRVCVCLSGFVRACVGVNTQACPEISMYLSLEYSEIC